MIKEAVGVVNTASPLGSFPRPADLGKQQQNHSDSNKMIVNLRRQVLHFFRNSSRVGDDSG